MTNENKNYLVKLSTKGRGRGNDPEGGGVGFLKYPDTKFAQIPFQYFMIQFSDS